MNLINFDKTLETCNGLIFRGNVTGWISKTGSYSYKETMNQLKKKSCSGCNICYPLLELLREDVDSNKMPIINNIIDKQLYKLGIVNQQVNWESGQVDDFDLEFKIIGN